jgi:hypothetical protein
MPLKRRRARPTTVQRSLDRNPRPCPLRPPRRPTCKVGIRCSQSPGAESGLPSRRRCLRLQPLQDEDGVVGVQVGRGTLRGEVFGSLDGYGRVLGLPQARGVKPPVFGEGVGLALLDRGLAVVAGHGTILLRVGPAVKCAFFHTLVSGVPGALTRETEPFLADETVDRRRYGLGLGESGVGGKACPQQVVDVLLQDDLLGADSLPPPLALVHRCVP